MKLIDLNIPGEEFTEKSIDFGAKTEGNVLHSSEGLLDFSLVLL